MTQHLRGYARLAIDGVVGVTEVVEAMHATIARLGAPVGGRPARNARGIAGFVYTSIRGVTRGVGTALDALLGAAPLPDPLVPVALNAVFNGICGDYLARTRNPLATPMTLRTERDRATPHVLVLAHGLCMHDGQWHRNGHDHGDALATALGCTPVYVRYNSGRAIPANGRELAKRLEQLVAGWPVPVERITLLGHSMGGLLLRAACAAAERNGHGWRELPLDYVSLGTPHAGAPLERAGAALVRGLRLSAYSAPLAALGAVRSAGIRDLRDGRIVAGSAPDLPAGVRCFAIAAQRRNRRSDGLVRVDSALGRPTLAFPADRTAVIPDADHFDLLDHPDVLARLSDWLVP